ncbi:MAG: class I SAM-dependent methyltransferase [Pseudomonadota bacterium]
MQTINTPCPACAHQIVVPFFDGGKQPLATIAWPASQVEAESMPGLRLDFVRCVACGHVFNQAFDYADVPYGDKPNLMFNRGGIWNDHLATTRDLVLAALPENPTVVEIGCGEGHFLRGLAGIRRGRYLGFDPNAAIDHGVGLIEARSELFIPATHLASLRPDLIVMRHVLEHFKNPLAFLQEIALHCQLNGVSTLFFAETPCIDRVFSSGRLADFYYEHHSHFTQNSFRHMLESSGCNLRTLATGYDQEVVYALAEFPLGDAYSACARSAEEFYLAARISQQNIGKQLAEISAAGKSVAIWGGTGKGAAFIHHFGVDRERFPLVVDSDPDKVGTFVPGAGQRIQFRDTLRASPVDIVIIPTQWRAKDIIAEMQREGIAPKTVLIEHQGNLVDFFNASHPYR